MFVIDHIALNVRDLNASMNFYSILGAEVTSKPSSRFMELRLGEVTLHLLPRGSGDPMSRQCIDHFSIRVPSTRDLERLATSLNRYFEASAQPIIQIQKSPPMGADGSLERQTPEAVLYFRDPDGNTIETRAY